jgi:hypothetical protein
MVCIFALNIMFFYVQQLIYLSRFSKAYILSHRFCKNFHVTSFWKSIQWEPTYSIWTDGWKDRHHETNTLFSELCAAHGVQFSLHCKTITRRVLTLIWLEGAEFEDEVTVVVNCHDEFSTTPDYCKYDISEYYNAE